MQRHNVIARCAKSRQTPRRSGGRPTRSWSGWRMLVAERDAIVDVVADRLHQRPTFGNLPNSDHAVSRQPVGLAVTAAEQIDQDLHRQVFQGMLLRLRSDRVRLAARPAPGSPSTWSAGRPARGSRGRNCRNRRDRCWRGSADRAACDPNSAGRGCATDARSTTGSWASAGGTRRKSRSPREFSLQFSSAHAPSDAHKSKAERKFRLDRNIYAGRQAASCNLMPRAKKTGAAFSFIAT